jgi:hypothetical protein
MDGTVVSLTPVRTYFYHCERNLVIPPLGGLPRFHGHLPAIYPPPFGVRIVSLIVSKLSEARNKNVQDKAEKHTPLQYLVQTAIKQRI